MKKIPLYAALFTALLFALMLNGCSNVFFEKPREYSGGETANPDIPGGLGTIQVSFTQGAARTVMPAIDLTGLYVRYWFNKDGAGPIEKTPETGVFTLEPGTYSLEVKVFADNAWNDLVAEGTTDADFIIRAGENAGEVNVTLRPIADEGEGSLAFSLEYPAGVTVQAFTLTLIAGGESPVDLAAAGTASGSDPVTLSGTTADIPAGYYLLRAELKNTDGTSTGRVEVVHIYRNLEAEASYEFIADDFRAFRVTTPANSGEGSLRQALTDALVMAAGPQLIQVLLEPGSEIELESALPTINKSMTIEGNGVTLTRAVSWSSSSQLLYIDGSGAAVTVRRVRFKNGKGGSGGGIRHATGDLTLESCIFSGNQNSGSTSTAGGGAVHSSVAGVTLTVRGCTFYNNTTGGSSGTGGGGAIYYKGTLTLTGNVFYGNTALYYPVVCSRGGTLNAASYNVVDTALGTTAIQCGWKPGEGDVQAGGRLVSALTFHPFAGAAGRLPAVLPADYPAVDFYGSPVRGGGAAGAVQEAGNGYYLECWTASSQAGIIGVSGASPDADNIYPAGSTVTITGTPSENYSFRYCRVNGELRTVSGNSLSITLSAHTQVQVIFSLDVNVFTDNSGAVSTPGTLRWALTLAQKDDIITFSGVKAGETTIELAEVLPKIKNNLTIEGSGITLTPSGSWTASNPSPLLNIECTLDATVTIRRVHFKNGRATGYGGAIRTAEPLTLESCIFSGNQNTFTNAAGSGGAINAANVVSKNLTIRGCTFYNNQSGAGTNGVGGAMYLGNNAFLTLTGNLFYGNSAPTYPVIRHNTTSPVVDASFNVVDVSFGTSTTSCGWAGGTGDTLETGMPVSSASFRILYGSGAANKLPAVLPADYPATDFYGDPVRGGGAAGAVQGSTAAGYYYLGLSVKDSSRGTITSSPSPDAEGLVLGSSSVTVTAAPNEGYSLGHWLINGVRDDRPGPLTMSLAGITSVQAVFVRQVTVDNFIDAAGSDTPGNRTLRWALTDPQDDDIIRFTGVNAGTTTIELASNLPYISKSITIEGAGVTLTRSGGATNNRAGLSIQATAKEVTIRRVHFKDLAAGGNGAIYSAAVLTLESCIFSGNRNTSTSTGGGAINAINNLTIRGCTFYGNSATNYAGAVHFATANVTLTLTGNLFYGNSATKSWPIVRLLNSSTLVNPSYNVVDMAFGGGSAVYDECGWTAGTGDVQVSGPQVSSGSFKLLQGSGAAGRLPADLPADYPATDFYGASVSGGGAAGAVQGSTTAGYYYLGLSVKDGSRGTITSSPSPDAEGLVLGSSSVTVTAAPEGGYSLGYWLINGVRDDRPGPLTMSPAGNTLVQAVFVRQVTVSNAGNSGPGTLREALTNVQDDDLITVSVTGAIELESALPPITRSLTIEGNGVTLTRAASWTAANSSSQLLYINNNTVEVTVRRVHFKNGLATYQGGAIHNIGILTLESCVFSGNRMTDNKGGALYSKNSTRRNPLTIRGCTFYNNNVESNSGEAGAVYYSGAGSTLTLTGNLFYGNSAAGGSPVVLIENAISSASYNVVDVPFGTGSTDCGWAAGTGDTTFSTLGISGGPFDTTTFVPAAALRSVLPSIRPAGFPAADFYGTARTFPGAPGAVADTP
jgi:hypothetical protein